MSAPYRSALNPRSLSAAGSRWRYNATLVTAKPARGKKSKEITMLKEVSSCHGVEASVEEAGWEWIRLVTTIFSDKWKGCCGWEYVTTGGLQSLNPRSTILLPHGRREGAA